ncbi:MAG: glycoside hydrolase family 15 protein [Steroidobacteraceae bacterium]
MTPDRQRHLDLAVVGNCEVAAIVDAQARRLDVSAQTGWRPGVLRATDKRGGDAEQGVFATDLVDRSDSKQSYRRNTAIVETLQRDSRGGSIRITDFCPRFKARGRMFRPMMFVRIIERLAGRPVLRLRLRPTRDYGNPALSSGGGSHHMRFAAHQANYRVTTDASVNALREDRLCVLENTLTFIIGPDETIEEAPSVFAHSLLRETRDYWEDWSRALAVPFDWQAEVIRAAITLKLCTYEDTGAVLAALTTSIPESANSGRNWDYRYCWMRDSYFVVQALNRLGVTKTMEGFLHYIDQVVALSGVSDLKPLYRLSGAPEDQERQIESLDGFLGMGPVRVGNGAANQIQNDVYGSVILAASQLFFDERLVRPGDTTLFVQLERLGERAAALFDQPDAGPWEFRGFARAHTFPAAMSWAGCDRLARIAARLGLRDRADHWATQANYMRSVILERTWNEQRQAYVASFDGDDLDAAVLLLPELGLLRATDPRFLSTLDVIDRELRDGDLLFRYRHADDFGTPETAFTVCAFWYVNAIAAAGRLEEARAHFTRLLAYRNPVGLLSEDLDPKTGALWGNFPQTYSLVGVINSALRLTRSWEEAL